MYKLLKKDGDAKRGEFHTVHGVIQTPVFMNVGTAAAIKGAVSTEDLEEIGTQVELSNTYHLHVRPGDEVVKKMGGLHKFMSWNKPILTDSGGFQVFSLAGLRKIKEEGVCFNSHIDGRKIFMGPEESMQIQVLIDEIDLPIIVDAGIGKPSQACEAMEMGAAAIMANTAIATAGNVPEMAAAFKLAIEAGRKAYLTGMGRVLARGGSASDPLTGFLH